MQTPLGTLFLSLKCYGNTSKNISANPVPREQVDTEYVDESLDKYTVVYGSGRLGWGKIV